MSIPMGLDPDLLRAFVYIAEEGSFTRAADRLHLTQPTLSHQVKQLEATLGTQLFERGAKDVMLTGAGELFRPYCERVLKELELGTLALSALEGLMRGTLRMAVSHSFSSTMLPFALSEFALRYPGVHVIARLVPRLDLERELLSGELDLAGAYVLEDTEHFVAETLAEEALVLVVGSDHPWAGREAVPMTDLAALPLILLTPEFAARQFLDRFFADNRLQPRIVLEMNAIEPILSTIRHSRLATVLSNGAILNTDGLRVIALTDPVPRRTIAILWRRHGHRSPAAQRMAATIQETYQAATASKLRVRAAEE
jgi:LysR family cyn operon transcriptional activator